MTTFDQFITNNPEQKNIFEKEYEDFLLSEFIIEKMEEKHLSVRALAKKASVSPSAIQEIRNQKNVDKIAYNTIASVLRSLGYQLRVEKIHGWI
ncbi:hypothetical protein [Bilifractor sp. HCP3S3_D3]|uniref:hypothetical protein n=1 Tax=Bilifractor sp. HCP3S3_D3 TaxID=3438907 RepID=UPI003F8B4141